MQRKMRNNLKIDSSQAREVDSTGQFMKTTTSTSRATRDLRETTRTSRETQLQVSRRNLAKELAKREAKKLTMIDQNLHTLYRCTSQRERPKKWALLIAISLMQLVAIVGAQMSQNSSPTQINSQQPQQTSSSNNNNVNQPLDGRQLQTPLTSLGAILDKHSDSDKPNNNIDLVAKAEALTSSDGQIDAASSQSLDSQASPSQAPVAAAVVAPQPSASSNKLFADTCKLQSRVGLHLTNLSQIVFQPSDVCSSWHKMMHSQKSTFNSELDQQQQQQHQPWHYIEQLNLSQNNLTVLHDSSGMSRLINLLDLKITYNQLARCEESSLSGLQKLQNLDLSHNKLVALPAKFFQPIRHTLKKLNLSFNSITVLVPALFDSLTSLEYLDLSNNGITSHWINDRLFKDLIQLHYLDLSFNKLTVFSSPMTFSSLQQLETLTLKHNELRQVPETLQHLHYLSTLDLSQNLIHDISKASYQSNCKLLFNLDLESNSLENITHDAFRDLPALKVLNLANNKINQLDPQAFEDVPDLHALRLDSNRLVDFGQSFVNLRFLLMLNISSNRISSFDYLQIPSGLQWLDLHSNKIDRLNNYWASPSAQEQFSSNNVNQQWQSMLKLTTLDASFNLIKEIDNTSLPESLETVHLNNNQIRSIASHTFSTKPNLTRINLSNNQLSTLPQDSLKLQGSRDPIQQQSMASANGQKFVDIYLSNNPFICNCNMGWLSQLLLASSTLLQGNYSGNANMLLREHQMILARQLPRIADAHLVNCNLPFARQSAHAFGGDPHQWSPVQAANQLALHHKHHIHSRDSPLLSKQSEMLASVHLCPYKHHCFALCYCCDFDACDCEMSCPENCSCYYDQTWSTNIVDCSANNQINANSQARSSQMTLGHRPIAQPVKFMNIPEKIPMDVKELYLDGLELLQLKGNALIGRKNLKSLYLNNSQIYSIEPKALATQLSLKVLQLNSNHLKELHGHEFEQQVELRELYLAHNQITSIANMTFSLLKSLQVLHLQNNQLYHMNFWSNLPVGHKLVSLNLGSNPWSCQCEQVEPMLQWLQVNVKHLHDRKSITCQYNRTNSLHLLPPLIGSTIDDNSPLATVYGSSNENYPMFDMRMCLNYTVYPMYPTSPPPTSQQQAQIDPFRSESRENYHINPQIDDQIHLPSNNSFIPSTLQQPNDEPFTPRPYNSGQQIQTTPYEQSSDSISAHGYQFPPASPKANALSPSFLMGASSMILIMIVLILSLLHYGRPMKMWFYSHYVPNMFSSGKSHNHPVGSLAKHSQLHHHHPHLHHQHNQYGVSSAGSTSSSSAASSNLSQALCQHQSSNGSSGLVTTPLIVANNHQLLTSTQASSTTTTATTLPYSDDDKLFDAYITYSKMDEQFVNEVIAPELEYGQPSYRVALHYRDLPVQSNEFLTDCIMETANASRRMIMVLSEQMLKSEWQQYEFRAAHLEALRNNYKQRLIIVILGQPSPANIDSTMAQWLESCTCLYAGDKMFWQRLRYAMPELPFNRRQPQHLRYQTLAPHQTNTGKQKMNLGANLLKSAGFLGGHTNNGQAHHHNQTGGLSGQLITSNSILQSLNRPLPHQPMNGQQMNVMQPEEHHYAHLTPSTMIYNQQQQTHTYHQPIYGDPQQQQQQQQHTSDNPTVPVHI